MTDPALLNCREAVAQAKAILHYGGGHAVTALETRDLIELKEALDQAMDCLALNSSSLTFAALVLETIVGCVNQVDGWMGGNGTFSKVYDNGGRLERLHDELRDVLNITKPLTPSGAKAEKAHEQLMQATLAGDLNAMKTAMAAGTNINTIRKGPGDSALHLAAAINHEQAVALLIEAGADPNLQNYRGFTPLHEAAFRDTPAIWNRLIEAGARDDIPAFENGHSPATLRDSLVWGQAMVDQSVAQAQRLAPPREMSMGR